jgi:hypothetical protein
MANQAEEERLMWRFARAMRHLEDDRKQLWEMAKGKTNSQSATEFFAPFSQCLFARGSAAQLPLFHVDKMTGTMTC